MNVDEDLELLQKELQPRELDARHPLRTKWDAVAPSSESRFEFQHLADDIRITRDVSGFRSLRRQMLKNISDFQNFRYELRIAGSLGRATGQTLLSLGGDGRGPDVEVVTLSKHKCGIACFRAADMPPSLEEAPEMLSGVVKSIIEPFRNSPDKADIMLEIAFSSFPLRPDLCAEAEQLLVNAWQRPEFSCIIGPSGTNVMRQPYPDSADADQRRVRIKARVPVPANERKRIAGKIIEKIQKEDEWASQYDGVPLFAVEESNFGLLMDAADIRQILDDRSHSFAGFLITRAWFTDNIDGSGRHLMERVEPVWRLPTKINLGITTFGNNLRSWGEGHAIISTPPSQHAIAEWDISTSNGVTAFTQVRELSLTHRLERVPLQPDGKYPTDPDSMKRLAEVIGRVRRGE